VFRNLGLTLFLVSCILLNGCEDRTNPMMDVVIPTLVDEPETDAAPSEEPVSELPVSLDIPNVEVIIPQRTDENYLALRPEDLPLYKTAEEALAAEHTVEYLNGLQEWLSTVCSTNGDDIVHTYEPLRMYFTIDYSDFTKSERAKFISYFQEPEGFWKIESKDYGRFDENDVYYSFDYVSLEPSPFSCN